MWSAPLPPFFFPRSLYDKSMERGSSLFVRHKILFSFFPFPHAAGFPLPSQGWGNGEPVLGLFFSPFPLFREEKARSVHVFFHAGAPRRGRTFLPPPAGQAELYFFFPDIVAG